MKTLIVVPAYNEQDAILGIVDDLRRYCPDIDFLVIDDCSADGTLRLLRENSVPHLTLPAVYRRGIGMRWKTAILSSFSLTATGSTRHAICAS